MFKNRLKESQQVWLPFRPPSTTNPPSLTTTPVQTTIPTPSSSWKYPTMTACQSYHLTFTRFSPSLSVRSFSASEAVNTAYRVEITATSTDSLPISTSAQRSKSARRRPYCPKSPPLFQPLQTPPRRSNGRALSPHARSCRFPRMKPFTALF